MRLVISLVALLATSPAHAASEATCTAWVLKAKVNATKIEQVDKAYYWCLNQDEDPPLVDGVVTVPVVAPEPPKAVAKPIAKPDPKPAVASSHLGCRRYRSFDPKTGTFLDYGHVRRTCK